MLYSARMKSESCSLPDAVHMSFRDGVKQNAWAGVAVAAAFVSRIWLKSDELEGLPRVLVAWLPLLPAALYLRTIFRWARAQDELQRRIQLEALCFGTLGMLFIALATDLLRLAGLTPRLTFGWEGYFAFTFFLYVAGLHLANRRYR
jgi:hypothetical protein